MTSRLAEQWYRRMLALLRATGRPWATDDLVAVVCGPDLTERQREAAAMAVQRLHARPDVRSGPRPPSSNGRAAA